MELADLKQRWNEILDELERSNRVAWLVFFDARLVSLTCSVLTIDFLDRNKLAAGHDFESHISANQLAALQQAISKILTVELSIEVAK